MNEKTWEHGGPAFPCHSNPAPGRLLDAPEGMKLRDYFAAKALQGLLAGLLADGSNINEDSEQNVIECAFRYADKMLLARGAT